MPSSAEQDAQPGTEFTNAELGRLMSLIQDKDFDETKALVAAKLTLKDDDGAALASDEQALRKQTRADLSQFFDVIGDGTIQAGQDFSQTRDKEEIRQRVRLRLGLPAISTVVAAQEAAAATARRPRRASTSFETKTHFS